MSGSSVVLVNTNSYRPSANSHKPNIINHFQQNSTQIKKSSSFNRPSKSNENHSSNHSKIANNSQNSKNSDSRSTVRNHVQFVLPLEPNNVTPTNISNSNLFTNVLTPSTSSSSINLNSANNNNNHISTNAKSLQSLNRISNTTPLKNLTSIRSSSFRTKNSLPSSTTKYEPSTKPNNPPPASNNDFMDKSRSCRSYESINVLKSNDNKTDDKTNVDPNTHNIHRLIKMATQWNSKSKSEFKSTTSGSSTAKYSKMSNRSLISQTKIRQTQLFLNDENKIDMERKMGDSADKPSKVNNSSIDEAFADAMSDKSVRVLNSNRTPQPIRILPMNMNRLAELSKNDSSLKKSVTSINDTNNFSNNTGRNNYWSNSNLTSEMGELGSSAKESSISSYLSKNNKAISFLNLKKNLNSSYKTSSSTNHLNRVSQGLPIHIQ